MSASISRYLGIAALCLLVVGPLGYHLHFLPIQPALLAVPAAALIGIIAAGIGAFGLIKVPAEKSRALAGLLSGLVPAAFFANVFVSGHGLPMIHDITTDTKDPPTFVTAPTLSREAKNSLDYDPAVVAQQQAAFPDLHGIATPEAPAAAFERARKTAAALGWEIYAQDAAAGHIEAVDTTLLFGFKDDVVIRVRAREGGSIVDLRSVSRVGGGDLGANAKRIRKFIAAYAAAG